MKRFVVIVLDGFGIGAMDDAVTARPGDERANTLRSILAQDPDMKLPNLEKLGLMNAYGAESSRMKMSGDANFGRSDGSSGNHGHIPTKTRCPSVSGKGGRGGGPSEGTWAQGGNH